MGDITKTRETLEYCIILGERAGIQSNSAYRIYCDLYGKLKLYDSLDDYFIVNPEVLECAREMLEVTESVVGKNARLHAMGVTLRVS